MPGRADRIQELLALATELASGNYDVPEVQPAADDEFGALHSALNMLAADLRAGEHERGRAREREELLAAVRRSEGRLKALLDQSPAAVWTTDRELRMRSCRGGPVVDFDAVEEVLGLPLTGVFGVAPDSALIDAHRAALEGVVDRTLDLGRGDATWEVHVSPMLAPDGVTIDGTVAVGLDVTKTRAAQARMQHAQKLESLGILAGGIAHDFNNLLVGMLGNASLALMDLPQDAPMREAVQRIEKAAARGSELTRQLLAYSGKGRFVVELIDLGRLVEEMTELLQVSLSSKAVLRLDLDEGAPPVRADASQLRQVVMNLITNASDAVAHRSGAISVRVGAMHCDAAYLDTLVAEGLEDGLYCFIEVSDTGPGMSPEVVARMFDPFFTTKRAGHGLGMAAVDGIVRGHGGGIKVYSEEGKGTTVKVLLPAEVGEDATTSVELPPDRPTVAGEGLCVLVADDQETVREVARAVLERAGYRVLLAIDGIAAIEAFDQHVGVVDAAVIDLTMPRASGEEVFRHIRSLRPGLPVLLTSGYNEQDATSAFVGKGLAGFLQKPWRARALLEKLEEVLGGDSDEKD